MHRRDPRSQALATMGSGLDRRSLLGQGAAALGLIAAGAWAPRIARGQDGRLFVLMPPSPLEPRLRDMIQERLGLTIEAAPYTSPTDNMAKLLAPGGGEYDVMVTLTDFVRPALGDALGRELLLPLDPALVPNLQHVIPLFADDVLRKDGVPYTAPFYWGYDSVLFNRAEVPEDDELTQSWGILFDDRYAGRVAIRDNAHQSLLITALHMGHENPLAMDRADLDEVTAYLISKKGNFRTLWTQFAQAVGLMSSGEVVAMYGWILMRTTLQGQGFDVTNNWPREGLLWWGQAAFVPAQSRSPEQAQAFIDYLLSAEYGHAMTQVTGGILSASALAREAFTEEERSALGYDIMERGLSLFRLGLPERLDLWLEAWTRFKNA
jgi:spermidine/putrescine transport system substrate-binding protein